MITGFCPEPRHVGERNHYVRGVVTGHPSARRSPRASVPHASSMISSLTQAPRSTRLGLAPSHSSDRHGLYCLADDLKGSTARGRCPSTRAPLTSSLHGAILPQSVSAAAAAVGFGLGSLCARVLNDVMVFDDEPAAEPDAATIASAAENTRQKFGRLRFPQPSWWTGFGEV